MTAVRPGTATAIAARPAPSPRITARIAGAFYLLNIVAGSMTLALGRGDAASRDLVGLIAVASYVVVVLLFHRLFSPVHRGLSLLAAVVGLAGCAAGALGHQHLARAPLNSLVFFGVYCLLIAGLILRSTFLPRALGWLLAFGGLGWLTFAYPPLARQLSPFDMAPGILAEGTLTVWLLVVGLDEERWKGRR